MTDRTEPDTECGSLIHFPPARCSRPEGHAGEHMTAEIPAPLSAVAARMVTESDRLDAERQRLQDQYADRFRRMSIIFWIMIVTTVLISATGIVAMVH